MNVIQRFFSPVRKRSLYAMVAAFFVTLTVLFIYDGNGSLVDMAGIAFYIGFFQFLAWLVFILPILSVIEKLMNAELKMLVPLFTAIYGVLVFVVLVSVLFGDYTLWHDFLFEGPTLLTVLAAVSGFVWGVMYLIISKKN